MLGGIISGHTTITPPAGETVEVVMDNIAIQTTEGCEYESGGSFIINGTAHLVITLTDEDWVCPNVIFE